VNGTRQDEVAGIDQGSGASACIRGLHTARDPEIYTAVLALLREVGYDRMTMDAVATRARVSKATIYRRWPGKARMVADTLRWQKFEVHVPADTGSLRGDLLDLLMVAGRMCAADVDIMQAVAFAMRTNAELAELMREHVMPAGRLNTMTIVDRAIARGEIPPEAAKREVFHDLAPAILMSRLLAHGQPADDQYLTQVVDEVLLPVLMHQSH
jgi:AcrR family transcriptional regulator